MTNLWSSADHANSYLQRKDTIPHRNEGESSLLDEIPNHSKRILDLGCGDGHLLNLVLDHCPQATGVGVDFSPTMLTMAKRRFENDSRVELVKHDFAQKLPDLGTFDCVVSSFAIHHCPDKRKREIYGEVFDLCEQGGVFCNLEHVSSSSEQAHVRFLEALGVTPEEDDPSNILLDVETQLAWLRTIGFDEVDCYWKWRELALLVGKKPPADKTLSESTDGESREWTIASDATDAEMRQLDHHLGSFNEQCVGWDDFTPVRFVVRDSEGRLVAGLKGLTGWNWLYVQTLWVKQEARRSKLGSRLLQEAEQHSKTVGCIGSCLSTYTFQAPDFYEKNGYQSVGKMEQYPNDHSMYFMTKWY